MEPGGKTARDRQAAEDLKAQLEGLKFDPICRQLLHAVWYGYSAAEALWEREGNRVILADLIVRSPERFRWDAERDLLLRTRSQPQGNPVPPAKFVTLMRPADHDDIPHGPGLARWCYWSVWLKRNGLKFWAVSLDKYGSPTPKGTYRKGANQEEIDKLLELIKGLSVGSGIALPEGQDIELMESARRAGADFEEFVKYLDSAITTTLLGQSSTTDQGPWKGTAEIQKDVRDEVIAADAHMLDDALNHTISRWLTEWNFPGAAIPRIRRDAEPPEDLDKRAERERIISETTGLKPTQEHVEAVYGGEWEPAPEPPPAPGNQEPALRTTLQGAAREGDTTADPLGDAAVDAANDWEQLTGPIIEPILAAAAEAENLEDFNEAFGGLAKQLDDEALALRVRANVFSAWLSGRAGLQNADDPDGSTE